MQVRYVLVSYKVQGIDIILITDATIDYTNNTGWLAQRTLYYVLEYIRMPPPQQTMKSRISLNEAHLCKLLSVMLPVTFRSRVLLVSVLCGLVKVM